jgi:A/G-specific adenine glycosylase
MPDHIHRVRRRLLVWGRRNFRSFPWRQDRDPYRTLVTEILLRQTNAERVEPIRRQFFVRYPDAKQLAKADRRTVTRVISSLGFGIQRTPQLIGLGQELAATGRAPRTAEALSLLPGVGDYTAAAAACFAFGAREVALDVNVARIVSRVFGIYPKTGELRKNPAIRKAARALVSGPNPRSMNWALLDLGALVCRPRPKCSICPLAERCYYARTLKN